MSLQPSHDTARQCVQRRIKGGGGGVNVWVSQQETKKETSSNFFFLFASTLAHSTISIKWDCAEELSLWPFSGEGILAQAFALTGKEHHVILHLIATVSS